MCEGGGGSECVCEDIHNKGGNKETEEVSPHLRNKLVNLIEGV